ncbi:transferase [Streptomyces sp. NPDC000134]|uniref:transferase n=1 Tax=Streptomyces sp. NPDC000134 TaxID=3364536 RepID=UPI0036C9A38C
MSTDQDLEPRIDCTVDADGRVVFGLRPAPADPDARLLLALRPAKGEPERVTVTRLLDLGPADGTHRRTAVLPVAQRLPEGRWDLYVVPEPDGDRQRARPGPRDLRALVDGAARDRSAPVAARVPYVTKGGFLALRTWLRDAHAEAGRITFGDGTMTVEARLHGAELTPGAAVRLRLRGAGTALSAEVRAAGDRRSLSFTADLADLAAPAATARSGRCVWDVFVRPGGTAPPARVGRFLDDVADRKDIQVYPEIPVGETLVRPYYTVDNDLSVVVARTG